MAFSPRAGSSAGVAAATALLVLVIGAPAASTARHYNAPVEVAPGVVIANLEAVLDERADLRDKARSESEGDGDGDRDGARSRRQSLGSLKPLKVTTPYSPAPSPSPPPPPPPGGKTSSPSPPFWGISKLRYPGGT